MIEESKLVGTWVSNQPEAVHNPDGSVIYIKREFTFSDGAKWELTFTGFGDEAETFPLFGGRVEGTYDLGQPSPTVDGAQETDFHFSKKLFTAEFPAIVDMFNQATSGGWEAGVQRDITETGCPFLPSVPQAPTEYDLLKQDGDSLYLGERSVDLSKTRATKLGAYAVVRS